MPRTGNVDFSTDILSKSSFGLRMMISAETFDQSRASDCESVSVLSRASHDGVLNRKVNVCPPPLIDCGGGVDRLVHRGFETVQNRFETRMKR